MESSNKIYGILFEIESSVKEIKKMLMFKEGKEYITVIEEDDLFFFFQRTYQGLQKNILIKKTLDREDHLKMIGEKITEISQYLPLTLNNKIEIKSNFTLKKYIHKNALNYLNNLETIFVEKMSEEMIDKTKALLC